MRWVSFVVMKVKDYLTKKELDLLFKEKMINKTQIWVKTKVKELPKFIVEMALELSKLDYINYIQLCDELLTASNMNYPNRPQVPKLQPQIRPNYQQPLGVEISYDLVMEEVAFQELFFTEKNSAEAETQVKEMMLAILTNMPKDYQSVQDVWWNNEFLENIKDEFSNYNWLEF